MKRRKTMANVIADLDAFKSVQVEEKTGEVKLMRVGIIGCGGIANSHVSTYLKAKGVQIVALCDILPGKAKLMAEKYGLSNQVITDYADQVK